MSLGELLTKLTVWLALIAYAIGAGMMLIARGRPQTLGRARWVWTVGCAFFVMHVVCAFSFYHQWSHAAAWRETARQAGAMTGLHWGWGLHLNYLFAAAWLLDVLWWWLASASFARRTPWLTTAWHGFAFFMVFNGAVIFARGPVRWLGVVICGGLAILWWRTRRDGFRRALMLI